MIEKKTKENGVHFVFLVYYVFNAKWNGSRCQSRWENLDRGHYRFQPIKSVNSVVLSPCETEPYNNLEYSPPLFLLTNNQWSSFVLEIDNALYGQRYTIANFGRGFIAIYIREWVWKTYVFIMFDTHTHIETSFIYWTEISPPHPIIPVFIQTFGFWDFLPFGILIITI